MTSYTYAFPQLCRKSGSSNTSSNRRTKKTVFLITILKKLKTIKLNQTNSKMKTRKREESLTEHSEINVPVVFTLTFHLNRKDN